MVGQGTSVPTRNRRWHRVHHFQMMEAKQPFLIRGRSFSFLVQKRLQQLLLLILLITAVNVSSLLGVQARTESDHDLYRLLGVTRTATTPEIKQAYRRKARDTHPDKNTGVPPEQAAEAFRQVVHAFEILSDETSRAHYDRTGQVKNAHEQQQGPDWGGEGGFGGFQWGFQWNFGGGFQYSWRLKDQFDVQQAQSRVLHVVSLSQLETVMLDPDHQLLERNLLMMFVTPGEVETHGDDEMVFPYPFAAMSSQGIWWEDLLQTVKVRYHRANDITRKLRVPNGDKLRESGMPYFLFGKQGKRLSARTMSRLQTGNREEFEEWVWTQIELNVDFTNQHEYPVELWWIHGRTAHERDTIQPNESVRHTSMLGHEWYVRDARVDTFPDTPGRGQLTKESSLGIWIIGVQGPYTMQDDGSMSIVIREKSCFDLSGHCPRWKWSNQCKLNPLFMEKHCALTCGFCEPDNDEEEEHDSDVEEDSPDEEEDTDEVHEDEEEDDDEHEAHDEF